MDRPGRLRILNKKELRPLMRNRGIKSLSQMADTMGMHRAQLSSSLILGKVNLKTLERLADVLGCEPGDLLTYEGGAASPPVASEATEVAVTEMGC